MSNSGRSRYDASEPGYLQSSPGSNQNSSSNKATATGGCLAMLTTYCGSKKAISGIALAVGTILILGITLPLALDRSSSSKSDNGDDSDGASGIQSRCILPKNPEIFSICSDQKCPKNYHLAAVPEKISEHEKKNNYRICHPDCDQGQHNQDDPVGKCVSNICSCSNGVAKTGENCRFNKVEDCASCKSGARMVDDFSLSDVDPLKRCVISNVDPVDPNPNGRDDPETPNIDLCPAFFHQKSRSGSCHPNSCVCENGIAMSQCLKNLQNICRRCDQGYILSTAKSTYKQCIPANNQNGNSFSPLPQPNGPSTSPNGSEKEKSCSEGFRLENGTCQPNICKCNNGQAVDSKSCTQHNANQCQSCNKFYHLENLTGKPNIKSCQLNECVCQDENNEPTGQPTESGPSGNCFEHKLNSCREMTAADGFTDVTCSQFKNIFHKISLQYTHQDGSSDTFYKCEKNKCLCENGTPATGEGCPGINVSKCQTCNTGFHIATSRGKVLCSPNECNCDIGADADAVKWYTDLDQGQICNSHKTLSCSKCEKTHYHFIKDQDGNGVCRENKCECAHGTAMSPCEWWIFGDYFGPRLVANWTSASIRNPPQPLPHPNTATGTLPPSNSTKNTTSETFASPATPTNDFFSPDKTPVASSSKTVKTAKKTFISALT